MKRDQFAARAAAHLDQLESIRTGARNVDLDPPTVPAIAVCHIPGCQYNGVRIPHMLAPNWDGDFRAYDPAGHKTDDITLIHEDGAETIGGEFVEFEKTPKGKSHSYKWEEKKNGVGSR